MHHSLVHFVFSNSHSFDLFTLFSTPEVSNQLFILSIVYIQFSKFVILELRMVYHLLGNSLSSEEPHSFNFKIWFISEHHVSSKGVLSEMVNSLQESVQEISKLILDLTFSFVFFIV